ncbi:MAG TPA: hypothetical protein VFX76_06415, partial [Roseiflexaceae bacterium]|nr:hypothetical protein [Roseiflexaceae bacterium]
MEDETRVARDARLGERLWHALLLVPESGLLVGLLCVYAGWRNTAVALLIALVCLWFAVRFAALALARTHIVHGQADAASALLTVARTLHPWSPDTAALEGIAALLAGDPAHAAKRLRRASTLLARQ